MRLKKYLATVLAVVSIFATFTMTSSAGAWETQPEGTERILTIIYVNKPLTGAWLMVGDANGDYVINQSDATHILRYILAMDTASDLKKNVGLFVDGIYYSSWWYPAQMDIDNNGRINAVDATLLLRYILWSDM